MLLSGEFFHEQRRNVRSSFFVTLRFTHRSDPQTLNDIPVDGPVEGIDLVFLSVSRYILGQF